MVFVVLDYSKTFERLIASAKYRIFITENCEHVGLEMASHCRYIDSFSGK